MVYSHRYIQLLKEITEGKSKPSDYWEIAALLESNGIRDIDAKEEWDKEDIFSLAKELYKYVDLLKYEVREETLEERPFLIRIFLNYLKGTLFALPMAIQIVSMVIVGVGIWSYIHFSLREATAIAFGTLLALFSTGGIAQMIGRKGLFYLKFGEYLLASKITKRFYLIGLILIVVYTITISFVNYLMNLFPFYMFKLAILYYILLSIIFLVFSIFYMLNDYFSLTLLTFIGVLLVLLFFKVFHFGIYTSQIFGMGILIVISNIIAFRKLRKLELMNYAEGVVLPKAGTLFYTLYPFFIYGSLYFLFLIMDRLMAWTTSHGYMPYFMWFNMPYEVGVDWALFTFIVTVAFIEVFINELGILSFQKIKEISAYSVKEFNEHFLRIYRLALVVFIFVGIISIIFSFFAPLILSVKFKLKYANVFFILVNQEVFWFASIGYTFLSVALLNCVIFFAYSRYNFALKSIALGVLINLAVGFAFSRLIEYYYAIVGLTVGSVVFAAVSTYYALKFFKRFHYYYYSAF